MGKIIAAVYLSIDGVMEDPRGVGEFEHGGWIDPFWDDRLAKLQADLLFASDALLLGRVTYQGFAAAWPNVEGESREFTDKINTMPKYVASRTLKDVEWNATLINGDVPTAVARLRRQTEQNILVYCSSGLVETLMQHDLIDQYRLMVFPIVLGSGARHFKGGARKEMTLIGSSTTDTGVLILDYGPASTRSGKP